MTKDIEEFYQRAVGDPALMASLMKDAQSPGEVLGRAMRKAHALGYQFSLEEATAWSQEQIENRANGELSDLQLAAIAGGLDKDSPDDSLFGRGGAIGRDASVNTGDTDIASIAGIPKRFKGW